MTILVLSLPLSSPSPFKFESWGGFCMSLSCNDALGHRSAVSPEQYILSPGGEDFTQNWGLAHLVAQTVFAETAALFLILNLEGFLKSFNLSFLKTLPHGTSWTQQSPVGIQVGRDTKRTFQSSRPEHPGPLSSRKLPGGLCPPPWDFQSQALRTLRVEVLIP